MYSSMAWPSTYLSRAPYGARGLKFPGDSQGEAGARRAPYGARGLKSEKPDNQNTSKESRPVWGAWIEILQVQQVSPDCKTSRPVWGAWIEIRIVNRRGVFFCRAPYGARGLKLLSHVDGRLSVRVAPRMGRVD